MTTMATVTTMTTIKTMRSATTNYDHDGNVYDSVVAQTKENAIGKLNTKFNHLQLNNS